MQQGYFFKLDQESVLNEGQITFRYLAVKKRNQNPSGDLIDYPIYLVLKPYAIEFYYNGTDPGQHETDETIEGKNSFKHVHIRLMHLPLSLNLAVKDNLTSRLKDFYRTAFQLGEEYRQELNEKEQAYWNLPQFYAPRDYAEIISDQYKQIRDQHNTQFVFYRKLILDFIFDLENTHVFENSPHYEELEVHLRENFFFNAITAKASYFYNRLLHQKNRNDVETRFIYAQKLAESEKQWLTILRAEQSCDLFWRYNSWFSLVEQEFENVLFDKKVSRSSWYQKLVKKNHESDNDNRHLLKSSAQWFIRRYDFRNAGATILQFQGVSSLSFISVGFAVIIATVVLFLHMNNVEWDQTGNGQYFLSVMIYAGIGVLIYFALFSIYNWRMGLPILGLTLPRLMMAITAAWFVIVTTEELWKTSFDVTFSDERWVFLILVPIFSFVALEIRNLAVDISLRQVIRRSLFLLVVGMFYSMFIGLVAINFTSEKMLIRGNYLEEFYLHDVAYEVGTDINDLKLWVKRDQMHIKHHLENENVILIEYEGDSLKLIEPSGPDTLEDEQMANKIPIVPENKQPFRSEIISHGKKLIKDNQQKSGIELFSQLKEVRLPFYHYFNSAILYDVKIIHLESFKLEFHVFPMMLFFRSIFALFAGIFIQLIFEDKPISEPL